MPSSLLIQNHDLLHLYIKNYIIVKLLFPILPSLGIHNIILHTQLYFPITVSIYLVSYCCVVRFIISSCMHIRYYSVHLVIPCSYMKKNFKFSHCLNSWHNRYIIYYYTQFIPSPNNCLLYLHSTHTHAYIYIIYYSNIHI